MPRIVSSYTVKAKGVGLPDYAAPAPIGQVPIGPVYTLTDLGELAVRLGSIDTFDRRGNVIFLDGFEDGLGKWRPWQSRPGHHVELSTARAKSGATSVLLTTETDPGDDMWIEHHMTFPVISKLGFEFSFSLGVADGQNQVAEIILDILANDGTYQSVPQIKWVQDHLGLGRWQYYGADGNWHDFAESLFDIWHWHYTFNTVKMVFDLATTKYTRLLVNNAEYDISGIDYRKFESAGSPRLVTNIGCICIGGLAAEMYVDDAIITQNEPPNPVL